MRAVPTNRTGTCHNDGWNDDPICGDRPEGEFTILLEDQAILTTAYRRCGRFDYSLDKRLRSVQKSVDNLTRAGYVRQGPNCTAILCREGILFVEASLLLKNHTARFQHFRTRYEELRAEMAGNAAASVELDAALLGEGYSVEEIRGLKQLYAIYRG